MAPGLVERIARTITVAAQSPAVREKMVADGLDPILNTPADFTKFLRADREQWLNVAKAINFRPQS
jgi:tripartite-type tricarboxylate transporter receptor subunit TctC